MSQLTLDYLKQILRSCAGVDESVDLDGDILDTSFNDLGYDSLAVLEVASRIQQELKVSISDDAAFCMNTPRVMIECVNRLFVEVEEWQDTPRTRSSSTPRSSSCGT